MNQQIGHQKLSRQYSGAHSIDKAKTCQRLRIQPRRFQLDHYPLCDRAVTLSDQNIREHRIHQRALESSTPPHPPSVDPGDDWVGTPDRPRRLGEARPRRAPPTIDVPASLLPPLNLNPSRAGEDQPKRLVLVLGIGKGNRLPGGFAVSDCAGSPGFIPRQVQGPQPQTVHTRKNTSRPTVLWGAA